MAAGWIKNKQMPGIKWGEVAPEPVFRKLYRPLGEIAFTFADLETNVTNALVTMIGKTWRDGAALESLVQSFATRIELFYFLAITSTAVQNNLIPLVRGGDAKQEAAFATLRDMAADIYTDLQQANSDRNNLLHSSWTGIVPNGKGYSKDRMSARAGKLTEIPIREVTTELLKEEARFIISLSLRVADWQARFRRRTMSHLWPPALPEKYLLRSPLGRLIQAHKSEAKRHQRTASRA